MMKTEWLLMKLGHALSDLMYAVNVANSDVLDPSFMRGLNREIGKVSALLEALRNEPEVHEGWTERMRAKNDLRTRLREEWDDIHKQE